MPGIFQQFILKIIIFHCFVNKVYRTIEIFELNYQDKNRKILYKKLFFLIQKLYVMKKNIYIFVQ